MTLPFEQLWNQGLDKSVQLDVLKILSRIAARPATRKAETPHDQSPATAPAVVRATPDRATNVKNATNAKNAASRENADD